MGYTSLTNVATGDVLTATGYNNLIANTVALCDLVSALPAAPVDGQNIYYQSAAMATAGVIWHLRYRSASASAYKWEMLGGVPMYQSIATAQAVTGAGLVDAATPGPSVTCPLAGDYDVHMSTTISGPAAAWTTGGMSATVGGATIGVDISFTGNFYDNGATRRSGVVSLAADGRVTRTAGQVIKAMYSTSNGTDAFTWSARYISALPVRVG